MTSPLPSWRDSSEELQQFARTKLLAVDLDGSLVRPSSQDVPETLRYLRRSMLHYAPKVVLTIATGRALKWVTPIATALDLKLTTPMVLYNGSVVSTLSGEVIMRRTIAAEALRRILRLAGEFGADVTAYTGPGNCQDSHFADPQEMVYGWSHSPGSTCDINSIPVQWSNDFDALHDHDSVAILIKFDSLDFEPIRSGLSEIQGISVTTSGDGSLFEVRPAGVDKSTGLEAVAKHFDLARGQVLALGDNDNDVEMLRWAGIGVCVAESTRSAENASDFVTHHGASSGAIEVLRTIKTANRYFGSGRLSLEPQ